MSFQGPQGPGVRPNAAAAADSARRAQHDADLRKVSRNFEALFLNDFLRTAREGRGKNPLVEESPGSDVYGAMLDEKIATLMAGKVGGLSDAIYRQLKGRLDEAEARRNGSPSSVPAAVKRP